MISANGIVKSLREFTGSEHARVVGVIWHHLPRPAHCEKRISQQVLLRQIIMPRGRGVFDPEPVAPIIAMSPVLRLAGLRFEFSFIRPKAKIAPADVHRFSGLNRTDDPAAVSIRAIKPIVQSRNPSRWRDVAGCLQQNL